jgi:hypothetical protein
MISWRYQAQRGTADPRISPTLPIISINSSFAMAFPFLAGKQLMMQLNNLSEQRIKKARRSERPELISAISTRCVCLIAQAGKTDKA